MFVCPKGKIYRGRYLSVPKEKYIGGDVCLSQRKDILGEMFVCHKGKIYRGRCLSVPKERYIGGDVCLSQRKDI
jgi:hypothetical protein